MAESPKPNWSQVAAAVMPNLTDQQRQSIVEVWTLAHARLEPLKKQLDPALDPDMKFDPLP
jgi:hypothetical protein